MRPQHKGLEIIMRLWRKRKKEKHERKNNKEGREEGKRREERGEEEITNQIKPGTGDSCPLPASSCD